jgi:acyl carrier protein
MGIYIFNRQALVDALDNQYVDFGKHVIPEQIHKAKVSAYIFEGYWEDIGTIRSFFEANLALAQTVPPFNFFDAGGHSLLAVQLLARIRGTWSIEIGLREFFAEPTVESVAQLVRERIRAAAGTSLPPIEPVRRDRPVGHCVGVQRGRPGDLPPLEVIGEGARRQNSGVEHVTLRRRRVLDSDLVLCQRIPERLGGRRRDRHRPTELAHH